MKKIVCGLVLGIILCSGIVYGANIYQSNGVEYTPTDTSWEVSNVSEAINSLHNMVIELENIKSLGNATASQILSGRTAVVQGSTITGTMVNNGAISEIIAPSTSIQTYTIPEGYHNGSGKITISESASGKLVDLLANSKANSDTSSAYVTVTQSYTIPASSNYSFFSLGTGRNYDGKTRTFIITADGVEIPYTEDESTKTTYSTSSLYKSEPTYLEAGTTIKISLKSYSSPGYSSCINTFVFQNVTP